MFSISDKHGWAQQKLSPLNILLSINGLLLSSELNGFNPLPTARTYKYASANFFLKIAKN